MTNAEIIQRAYENQLDVLFGTLVDNMVVNDDHTEALSYFAAGFALINKARDEALKIVR